MNKKGMTLIELLVYMAIAALLLTPIVILMQNSSLNMARDAVNTDMRISGRDILNIMYDDIRNTGFKLESSSGMVNNYFNRDTIQPGNPGSPVDSSSFIPNDGGQDVPFDALTIRKGRLKNSPGAQDDGKWEGYDSIVYFVRDNSILVRQSFSFDEPYYNPPQPVERVITRNAEALQFQYSANLNDWYCDNNNIIISQTGYDKTGTVKYIKISIVTVDKKKLSPVKTSSEIKVGNYTYDPPDDQYLREVHEIVVPIPNNGLFP